MSNHDIFKNEILKFKCFKWTEKQFILCSVIGRIDRKVLSSLQLSLEPHSIDFHSHVLPATTVSTVNQSSNAEDEISMAARLIVSNVIDYSVDYLRNEYIKVKSFDKYLLRDSCTEMPAVSTVCHTHTTTLPKGGCKRRHTKMIAIFKSLDATSMVISLCSNEFTNDDRKRFVTELLYEDDYQVTLHICLCVKKRLEEKWSQENIPANILLMVFKYISASDLMSTALVCKKWLKPSRNNTLWRDNCSKYANEIGLRKIADVVVDHFEEEESKINWFEIYKTFLNIFSKYKPKDENMKIERLSFLKERLPEVKCKKIQKPKVVKLLPVKHDVGFRDTNVPLKHSSRSFSMSDPNPDNDKRQLMKPILGHLKRFQNSDEFAIDCKPSRLTSLVDNMNHLESKIELQWNDSSMKSHNRRPISNKNSFRKMVNIENCFRLTGHLDGITFMKCDKFRIVSSSLDGTIRIWDSITGRSIRKMVGHKGGIYCLDFNDQILVSGGWDMSIIVWSMQPNFNVIKILYGHKDTITSLKIIEEKNIIISGSMDATLRFYKVHNFGLIKVVTFSSGFSNGIRDMRVQIAVNAIVTAHNDGSIRMTDLDREQSTIVVGTQIDSIKSLFLQSQLLISGGSTGYLQFWEIDMKSYKCVSKARLQIKTDSNLPLSIESITYFAKSLWTGHEDGTIKEWHMSSMTCLRTIMGHKGSIKQICFLGNQMITASLDSSIRMWKMSSMNAEEPISDKYDNFRERVRLSFFFK